MRALITSIVLSLSACVSFDLPVDSVRGLVRSGITGAARELVCTVEGPNPHIASFKTSDGCIHYDPLQLEKAANRFGPAVVIAIIAHEVAHSKGANEQQADEVAGCAVILEGYDLGPVLDFYPEDRQPHLLRGAIHCAPTNGNLTTL